MDSVVLEELYISRRKELVNKLRELSYKKKGRLAQELVKYLNETDLTWFLLKYGSYYVETLKVNESGWARLMTENLNERWNEKQ